MEEGHETPNRWKKPVIGAGVVALLVICLFAAGLSQTDLGKAASEYEKNKADAEKEGLYFTREQVDALYVIPESENSATLISDILPLVHTLKLDNPKTLTEQSIQEKWHQIEPAIAKIEEASHRKSLMFKRDFTVPAMTLFPQYSDVRQWTTLLVQMGHFSAQKGDLANAKKYWLLAGYLGSKIDQEGLLIGMLVRIACLAILEKELQVTIAAHGKDPAMVKVLDEVISNLDQPYDLRKPLKMEHWFGTSMIDAYMRDPGGLQAMTGSSSLPIQLRYGPYLPRFKVANLSRIHRYYADSVRSLPKDPYDLVGIDRAFSDMDEIAIKHQGLSYTMLSIIAPVFSQAGLSVTKEIAQRNVLAQAVALLKTGVDPTAGLPLKGRFAMDVDGKPIRIKRGATGWLVYSVGMDKVDDGGVEMKNGKGDFAVHLPH